MKTSNADTWFSRYIRLRDAWESNGVLVVKCFTCGKIRQAKEMENSHFMPRVHKSTRWDEINCEPACNHCNWTLEGNKQVYAERIEAKHGSGTVERLRIKARMPTKVNEKLISDYYREKVNLLIKNKCWESLKWW